MLSGIDVSNWQGPQNWASRATQGTVFAFCKATEGLKYADPTYGANISGMKAAGIVRGSYHFAHPEKNAASVEAGYYLRIADPGPGHIIALDLESGLDTLGGKALRTWTNTWLGAVKAAHPNNRVILYCNKSYWLGLPGSYCADGLWIAEYGVKKPTIADPWLFWQSSDDGIDVNHANFATLDLLKAWAQG